MSPNENCIIICENDTFTFGGSHIRTQDSFNCRASTGFTTWNSIIRVSLTLQATGIYLLKYLMDFWRMLFGSSLAQGLQQCWLGGRVGCHSRALPSSR
jgi:hypothetical protein